MIFLPYGRYHYKRLEMQANNSLPKINKLLIPRLWIYLCVYI